MGAVNWRVVRNLTDNMPKAHHHLPFERAAVPLLLRRAQPTAIQALLSHAERLIAAIDEMACASLRSKTHSLCPAGERLD
jgi:hypothetical protein